MIDFEYVVDNGVLVWSNYDEDGDGGVEVYEEGGMIYLFSFDWGDYFLGTFFDIYLFDKLFRFGMTYDGFNSRMCVFVATLCIFFFLGVILFFVFNQSMCDI